MHLSPLGSIKLWDPTHEFESNENCALVVRYCDSADPTERNEVWLSLSKRGDKIGFYLSYGRPQHKATHDNKREQTDLLG